MNKELPEWFNKEELDTFITEGALTRQAWITGLKRWRRTKVMLRNLVGQTPMKYISRVMKMKHAIMSRTANRNARDIQAAQDREQDVQSKRNYIKQENVNLPSQDSLMESFTKGSQRAFNLGVRPSAGERATMRNPLGNEKVKARLKKREQRKDMKRKGLKVEQMDLLALFEAKKSKKPKNPKRPIGKKKYRFEKGKKQEGVVGERAAKSNTKKETGVKAVQKGEIGDVVAIKVNSTGEVKIVQERSFNPKVHTRLHPVNKDDVPNKGTLKNYLKNDDFTWTDTSKSLFPKDWEKLSATEKKEKKAKAEEEKPEKKISKEIERKMTDKFGFPPIADQDKQRPHPPLSQETAKDVVSLVTVMDDSKTGDTIRKSMEKGKLDQLRQNVEANPGLVATAERLYPIVISTASQTNPRLAGKELAVLPFGPESQCTETSKLYQQMQSMDNTPKTDAVVLSKDKTGIVMGAFGTSKCAKTTKEMTKDSYRISIKKGKASPIMAQATETLALISSAQDILANYFKGNPPEAIKRNLQKLIVESEKLKSLASQNSGMDQSAFSAIAAAMQDSGEEDSPSSKFAKYTFKAQSAAILKSMNDILDELLTDRVVKAAIIWESSTGEYKFGGDSFGRADAIFALDDMGNHTGTIPLFENFEQALESEEFMKYVDVVRLTAGRKTKMGGSTLNPFDRQQPINLAASFDPLVDSELDNLFEYTFLPPDMTISTMAPDVSASDLDQNTMTLPMDSYQNQMQQQEEQLGPDNILQLLVSSGFFQTISAKPIDFSELGMQISSMNNPITTRVVVNGKYFEIPVLNSGVNESIFDDYESVNDGLVEMVKAGLSLEEAQNILSQQIDSLLEERNYKREYKKFHGKPKERAKRSKRVLARRKMAKRLGKKAIHGKDIDHVNGNAMDNSDKNLRVRSINKNRADNKKSKTVNEGKWWERLVGSYEWTKKMLEATPGQGQIDPNVEEIISRNKGTSR